MGDRYLFIYQIPRAYQGPVTVLDTWDVSGTKQTKIHALTCLLLRGDRQSIHKQKKYSLRLVAFVLLLQLWLTLCDPMDCSPPDSSVHGILQARNLEWVAMPSSRKSSRPRDPTCASYVFCIGRWVLYH